MGLFSIFKAKKDASSQELDSIVDAHLLRGEPTRMGDSDAERARQREIARATAAKIDAIEKDMTSDIFDDEAAWSQQRKRARTPAATGDGPSPTLLMEELATTELLGDELLPEAVGATEGEPAGEEIAILYANGELALAEVMLTDALGDDRMLWWMLFDLLQLQGNQDKFDSVAIDYASKFETSPPTWNPPAPAEETSLAGVTPSETFAATLDASIAPQLDRLRAQAGSAPALRLDFSHVREADAVGSALLLGALQSLRKQQTQLMLAGVAELADLLRARLEVGKRDSAAEVWLLLLELQQLLNREKEFEETAMDYCVTYEVSPPSFESPKHVAAAPARALAASDRFLMPALVEGNLGELLDQVDLYISQTDPAILDCSRLARIEYAAAGKLLQGLRPLAAAGRKVEMRDMNHLVAALCKLLGYPEVARLFPHKY